MDNPLSKLALDYWYQVLMVIGIAIFLLAGAGLLKAFPVLPTSLVALGVFWVGIGEWANHPLQVRFIPAGVVRGHPRNARFVGIAFDIIGAVFILVGGYKFFA